MSVRAGARVAPRPRPQEAPARPRPRAVAAPRAAPRTRLRLPRYKLVIPLVALLLGGIVWVKVAQLREITRTSHVIAQYQAVKSETLRLGTELARRDGEVIRLARERLGMVPANGVTYLKLPPSPPRP